MLAQGISLKKNCMASRNNDRGSHAVVDWIVVAHNSLQEEELQKCFTGQKQNMSNE